MLMKLNQNELDKYLEKILSDSNTTGVSKLNDNNIYIINVNDEIEFSEKITLNKKNEILFNKRVFSSFDLHVSSFTTVTFKIASISNLILYPNSKINLIKCKIEKISNEIYNQNSGNLGYLYVDNCKIENVKLSNIELRVKIISSKIGSLFFSGRDFLDLEISGKNNSKSHFENLEVHGDYTTHNSLFHKGLKLSYTNIKNKSIFAAKNIDIEVSNVNFLGFTSLKGSSTKILNKEKVKFSVFEVYKFDENLSLFNCDIKQLELHNTYNSVIIDNVNIDYFDIEDALKIDNLTIQESIIGSLTIPNDNLKSLEIIGSKDSVTRIHLLRFLKVVNTYCSAQNGIIDISRLEFDNCNIGKEYSVKCFGIHFEELVFSNFHNYGNLIFSDTFLSSDLADGVIEIGNSDLGKAIFMNCNFSRYKIVFVSSKITEIFLASTSFPKISDENYRTVKSTDDHEQRRLIYTQLKKVFENRGDFLNSTKFHRAELEAWEKELQLKEKEKSNSKIDNWLKNIKLKILNWIPLKLFLEYWNLKILNWISLKLFPEYWDLSKENLDHKKLIFSQYKKMYESRGDTVKAIEYQGKELDVHRTILCKEGGQYLERFQLSLNKYSNNFGRSWHWAVGWILVIGFMFYTFYCCSLGFTVGSGSPNDIETFKTLFSYFFEFINPIRKGEFIQITMFIDGKIKSEFVTITGWARFIDFFWRIVITYLGYQLIQAFRKYSKKTS